MDYFKKIEQNLYSDLTWNIPDNKQGEVNVIGGNSQNFNTEVKNAELLSEKFPIKTVNLFLPDALKTKLPPLENFRFLPSTDSGSFADSDELKAALNSADFNLLTGNFSKHSITERALSDALKTAEKPTLITRDTTELIAAGNPEQLLMNDNLFFFTSLPGIQKLFQSVYYPKVITLSQSLIQIAEALHKFTLSYPVSLITFHNGQILVAKNGNVSAVAIENTSLTPLTLWGSELAAKITAYNLYNPNNFEQATISSLF
jgi:hypothetical protein